MTKGITIYTITDDEKVIVSGLTVKLVNPGDNWSSGSNITLAEDGTSGYYENSSVTSNQEGYYEVWHNKSGSGADSGQRVNVGMLNHAGLKTDAVEDNNIKDGEVPHAKLAADAVEEENIKDQEVFYTKWDTTAKGHTHPSGLALAGFDGGGRKVLQAAAYGISIAATTFNIDINIPDNARIIEIQLRVDIALSQNWNADFNGGSSASICTDIDKALNIKKNVHLNNIITTDITDITITSQVGNFVADSRITASVFYVAFDTMSDYGV